MLIRAAIACADEAGARSLTRRLVEFSLRSAPDRPDAEMDVAWYGEDLEKLLSVIADVDLVFLSYELLERNPERLSELHRRNPRCISVPVGPWEGMRRFLALRPGGHLEECGDQAGVDRLCSLCVSELSESRDVLQIHTRQGSYAVSAPSILYCQSDQKYVAIVTDSGKTYRKLGKLDDLEAQLPDSFFRVHQSFLVNSRRLKGIDRTSSEMLLDSEERIPISRAYRKAALEKFQMFLSDDRF